VAAIVLTADCLPVALAGPARWAWCTPAGAARPRRARGRVAATGPWPPAIGPGIGPCCYEVGDDVRAVFGTSERTLDLKAIARERLRAAGVETIHDCGLCTGLRRRALLLHRRDRGVTGRQAGLAWRS
jgi:copper oxidase (laccase) domain-containing protein